MPQRNFIDEYYEVWTDAQRIRCENLIEDIMSSPPAERRKLEDNAAIPSLELCYDTHHFTPSEPEKKRDGKSQTGDKPGLTLKANEAAGQILPELSIESSKTARHSFVTDEEADALYDP